MPIDGSLLLSNREDERPVKIECLYGRLPPVRLAKDGNTHSGRRSAERRAFAISPECVSLVDRGFALSLLCTKTQQREHLGKIDQALRLLALASRQCFATVLTVQKVLQPFIHALGGSLNCCKSGGSSSLISTSITLLLD